VILLDTDHLTVLKYEEHPRCRALRDRMDASEDPAFATLRLHIGTLDLKIAAIARIQGALLLSANQRDFGRVPALRVENWLT
jgi:predicted nucleic acid-binding protein